MLAFYMHIQNCNYINSVIFDLIKTNQGSLKYKCQMSKPFKGVPVDSGKSLSNKQYKTNGS